MAVRKGSLTSSILLGVFVVYANVQCTAKDVGDGEVRLVLEWSNPWWQGVFGPGRTRTAVNGISDRLEHMFESRDIPVQRKDS